VFDRRAAARGDTDPKLVAERQQLEKMAVDARRKLDAAAKTGNADGISAAGAVAGDVGSRLDRLILTFGEVTIVDRGVPEPLARAAAAFFAGDVASAEELLDPEGGLRRTRRSSSTSSPSARPLALRGTWHPERPRRRLSPRQSRTCTSSRA
jgi:hypothetical protein